MVERLVDHLKEKEWKIEIGNKQTMATSKLTFSFILINFFASFLFPEVSLGDQSRQPKRHVAMFIFGDSIFDAGNDNYINISVWDKADHWPYGETFFHFPTGRYTDGRLIVDFIATKIDLPFVPPYLQPDINFTNGVNFASGGAGVFHETDPEVVSLGMQLSNFKNVANSMEEQLGDKEAKKLLSQAVYMTCVGGNDYTYFVENYPNATKLEQDEFVKILVGNLTDFVKELYTMGARKFAILNVEPRGCLPAVRQIYELRGNKCEERSLEMIKKHNSAASIAIKELESKLSGFKYSILDFYTILYDMIKDPKDYGTSLGFDNYRVLLTKQIKPHLVFHSISFGNCSTGLVPEELQCHLKVAVNMFSNNHIIRFVDDVSCFS